MTRRLFSPNSTRLSHPSLRRNWKLTATGYGICDRHLSRLSAYSFRVGFSYEHCNPTQCEINCGIYQKQPSLMSKNSHVPARKAIEDTNGRFHIRRMFLPQLNPSIAEQIGLMMENSIMHNTIPKHSVANRATANGNMNITVTVTDSPIINWRLYNQLSWFSFQ